jgi:prepilin-type N-terminal cleavage/methylation domain-containing protein
MLTRARARFTDDGFSLAEVLVAITMIGMLAAVLASLLVQSSAAQSKLMTRQVAGNLMQVEVSAVESAPWRDVMLRPAGATGGSVCALDGRLLGTSAQAVRSTDRIVSDGVVFDVTRDVRWYGDGTSVTCANTPNDREDLKKVTITVEWWSDSVAKSSRSIVLLLSANRVAPEGTAR